MVTDGPLDPLNYEPPSEPIVGADGTRTWSALSFSTGLGYRPVLLDVRVPAANAGTPVAAMVWVHGGAWFIGDRRRFPPTLTPGELAAGAIERGLAYVAVDYRLSLEAPFPAQIHDVKAALRYLRRFATIFGIDPDRLGALGESAGGHLVALLATTAGNAVIDGVEGVRQGRTDVAAVVDWYGIHDIAAFAAGQGSDGPDPIPMLLGQVPGAPIDAVLAAGASPIAYVNAGAAPMLLVHGDADTSVPISQSEDFVRAGRAAGMELEIVRVPGADHGFFGYPDVPALVVQSLDWLAERLRFQRMEIAQPAG